MKNLWHLIVVGALGLTLVVILTMLMHLMDTMQKAGKV